MRLLSYFLGDGESNSQALIAGRSLPIRASLTAAIQYLRLRDTVHRLWIHASCIDLSNSKGRLYQFRCRKNIYKNCTRVTAWPGSTTLAIKDAALASSLDFQQPEISMERAGNEQMPATLLPQSVRYCSKELSMFCAYDKAGHLPAMSRTLIPVR